MNAVAGQPRNVLLRRELSREKQALLAKRLRDSIRHSQSRDAIPQPITRTNATEGPLSFAQQRLWFLEQLDPGQPVYHVPFSLRLTGPLDYDAVADSLTEIVRRHEALRTTFQNRDGTPIQVVMPPRPVTVPVVDLKESELRRRLADAASRPFDLTRDLLLRVTLFRIASERHVLLFTMHHIASDAWSISLLLEEWTTHYDARVAGESVPSSGRAVPELPVQYLDFALWQRQRAEQETEQLAYWTRQLGDNPSTFELPSERPRPAVPSSYGETRSLVLGAELSESLCRLAQAEGATKFMALLAAFDVLLHRYSGQDDIVVGSPISRRTQQETEHLVGLFLNVSVLRADVSGNPTFRELLRRVRKTALDAYARQNVPFERVVEELQPARDMSRTPLFQVMFTFQEEPMPARTLAGGLGAEVVDFDLDVSPFDLTLLIQENEAGLVAKLEYKSDLFSAEAIDRMLGHFRSLLEGIAQNPGASISELPLLTPAERRQLLVEFNSSQAEYPREKSVPDLFEEQAHRTPDLAAVKFGSHVLTYRELDQRANQLAHHLKALGVGLETLVGICMERSHDMIVAMLGILKAGAAYVPFEPDEARERLAFKLRDSGVRVLLTQQALLEILPDFSAEDQRPRIICLDRERAAISRNSRKNPGSGARRDNLIYVIYTSGSTGVPKGVLVEHRCIVNHSIGFARRFSLTSADRTLQFAPLSFDVSAEEIFPTLLTGGTLVLRPAGLAVSIRDFHPFLANEKLTVVNLPTPYWSQWMTVMEEQSLQLPPSLRLVVVGSDTVTREQYGRWQKLRGATQWCNAYGTTEATITATIYEPESDEIPQCVPIGRPIMNTQVYILDRSQQLAPIGVPGEIFIGGDEVARGYLNRPEATAANFVADSFSREPGARLNRTGDFGRWRADGNIEFLGRRDNQVKIRGFRIELGEVESALLEFPGLKDAVVLPREEASGEKCLVAYLVAADEASQLSRKLLQFLKQRLPPYMIPASFVPLPELPRLSSGKLDRKALPPPRAERPALKEDFVAPSDSLEEKLANVWRQVLGLEKIGVHDNFFELGGHSLLAMRLFAEIEKLTGWNLPVLTLFGSPTIKQLAEIIRRTQSRHTRSSILTVQPQGSKPPLFLVHGAAGGMLWGYANLAKYMGADQPVYALNSRGMHGLEEFATVEELAAQYVQELRAFQPRGPYYLGGYCFGGEVAFEMAQQIVAQDERVGLLVLMNSMPPNSGFDKPAFTPMWALRFVRNAWHWFAYSTHWTRDQWRTFVQRKLRACSKRLWRCLGREVARAMSTAEDEVDLSLYSEDQRRLWEVHLQASDNYHPRPYPGSVTVFRARYHPFFCSFDPTSGWGEFAEGGVSVKILPGGHESILDEPHVRVAAAELKECLRQAHALMQQEGNDAVLPLTPAQQIKQILLTTFFWLLDFAPAL